MRPILLILLVFSSLVALRAQERHVILICLDGFAARHLDNPAIELPNLRALAAKGARAQSSETIYPSVTHPAHTTLITGVTPREHGILYNVMTNRETGKVFNANTPPRAELLLVPTLFDGAKKKGLRTAAYHWPQVAYLIIGNIEHYLVSDPRPGQAIVRARAKPAHSHGYLPSHPKMYSALIFSGAGVKSGATLGHVRNLDVAPTIARFLGLDLPKARGRVLTEALSADVLALGQQ